MSHHLSARSNTVPDLFHEMVNDRIQTLHREAAEERLALRLRRLQRARLEVARANQRLREVLTLPL